jgi:hypothetical protein
MPTSAIIHYADGLDVTICGQRCQGVFTTQDTQRVTCSACLDRLIEVSVESEELFAVAESDNLNTLVHNMCNQQCNGNLAHPTLHKADLDCHRCPINALIEAIEGE